MTAGQENPIKVLIVDDHPLVRDGLRLLMLTTPDLTLAGEAATGEKALQLCRTTAVDIVLMDLKMPGMDGVQATRAICSRYPQIKVIALTSFAEKNMVEQALQAGAISYILKNASSEELANAIRAAYKGQTTISSAATRSLVQIGQQSQPQIIESLTSREQHVLTLIASGLSNNEIGLQLSIQPTTVNYHVGNILSKLGASNRTEAVAIASKLGLIS